MSRVPKAAPEKVGYGRPPKRNQFKPGKSGNPKGRPKGSRSIGAILQQIIQQKVSVTENGRTRKLSSLEVTLRRLANEAMRGDHSAIKLFLALYDRYSESPEATIELRELLAEDEAILARYLKQPSNAKLESQAAREKKDDDDDEQ